MSHQWHRCYALIIESSGATGHRKSFIVGAPILCDERRQLERGYLAWQRSYGRRKRSNPMAQGNRMSRASHSLEPVGEKGIELLPPQIAGSQSLDAPRLH